MMARLREVASYAFAVAAFVVLLAIFGVLGSLLQLILSMFVRTFA